ncbi:MAG: hypothetical protein ACM3YE_16305 [Bacteroidota bacterium]
MYAKDQLKRVGLTIAMFFLLSAFNSVSASMRRYGYELSIQNTPLPEALEKIGSWLGFTFIVDPNLKGLVTETIQYDWPAETILTKVLEPFGYSYQKIDNYYLIGGPGSPLSVFAHWDSFQIPVGFLTDEMSQCMESFKSYLSYDKALGVVFVKAPSSMINQVLDGIWKAKKVGAQLSVIYNFSIFELINTKELDVLFSGTLSSSNISENKGTIITPDQISTEGHLRLQSKMMESKSLEGRLRQPRVLVLPGKTMKVSSKYHFVGDEPEEDQNFSLSVTPVNVDPSSGEVLSEININGYENRINSVLTTILTKPGTLRTVAVVRKVSEKKGRLFLGKYQHQEARYYMLTIEALPLNVQQVLAASQQNVLSVADLDGLFLNESDSEQNIPTVSNSLEIGLSIKKHDLIDPWVNLYYATSPMTSFKLLYEGENYYSISLNRKFRPDDEAYFDISAGEGIGPDRKKAVLLGFGDQTKPWNGVTFFAKYYPWSFLTDTEEFTTRYVWDAGLAINEPNYQLTLSALGDPDFEGYRCKLGVNVKGQTWVLGVDTTENHSVSLGLKFEL